MNAVGVIIVDYRSDPFLEHALASLSTAARSFSLKVVVVQNSPTGPPPAAPEALDVRFLRQETNLGFGRAVNLARRSLQTPYFLLLNPDVKIFPEMLSALHDHMEQHPDVGLAVPKLLDRSGALQLSVRTFYDFPTILLRRTPLGRVFPNHPRLRRHLMIDWDHDSIREIDWALGACMLIREKAVGEEIFDPRFFLYFEDVDLCLRLRRNGWRIVYHPKAVAIHEHRQKSRKNTFSRANFEHLMSWIKFMIKHKGVSVTK